MPSILSPSSRFSFVPQLAVAAILVAGFAFGGGGSRAGLANFAVQLVAFIALAACPKAALEFWRKAPRLLKALVILSIALPILQIIPLPTALWTALPGRDLAAQSLAAAGYAGWMPASLYPLRTAVALSALVTPLAVLMIGWSLPRKDLFTLAWLVAGLGLATLVLGIFQLSNGTVEAAQFGQSASNNVLRGTFANRNSTGVLLTGALAFAALLPAPRPFPAMLPLRIALCVLILVGIILTQSRTALVISLIPIALVIVRIAAAMKQATRDRARGKGWLVALAVIGMGALSVTSVVALAPGRVADTISRFEGIGGDSRFYFWEDATYASARYWPIGAGIGTFEEVFQVDEALENVSVRRAGRAHNDFLELAIEAGVAGLGLVGLWLALIGWLTWQARLSSQRWAAWGASSFLFAIALQSITDYPLRNQTLLAVAAFALLLLAQIATSKQGRPA